MSDAIYYIAGIILIMTAGYILSEYENFEFVKRRRNKRFMSKQEDLITIKLDDGHKIIYSPSAFQKAIANASTLDEQVKLRNIYDTIKEMEDKYEETE